MDILGIYKNHITMAKAVKLPIPEAPEVIRYVDRKIHFYELYIDFDKEFIPQENADKFLGFFSIIAKLAKNKNKLRYQPVYEAKVFMQDVKFIDAEKRIIGKMLYVKMDVFPELIDTITDETKDIETLESQGIVETTHFVIDYSKNVKKIAIEYNHAGAKIGDFITYFQLIGAEMIAIKKVFYKPIVKDELAKMKERIGTCSTIDIRVHKDNISQIENLDNKFYTSLKAVSAQYQPQYIEIKLRFSYRNLTKVQKVKRSISNIIDGLVEDKNNLNLFETLKIRAMNRENNFKMELFDLLIDKVESEVEVQRKSKHKVIISADMFEKIKSCMIDKKI